MPHIKDYTGKMRAHDRHRRQLDERLVGMLA